MSEERFDRIEGRRDQLEAGQNELRADVAVLKTDVAGLKTDVAGLKTDVSDLGRYMRVLHEDAIARTAAVAESVDVLRTAMLSAFADLGEKIGRRLDPLELRVRQHSIDIEGLKEQRG